MSVAVKWVLMNSTLHCRWWYAHERGFGFNVFSQFGQPCVHRVSTLVFVHASGLAKMRNFLWPTKTYPTWEESKPAIISNLLHYFALRSWRQITLTVRFIPSTAKSSQNSERRSCTMYCHDTTARGREIAIIDSVLSNLWPNRSL